MQNFNETEELEQLEPEQTAEAAGTPVGKLTLAVYDFAGTMMSAVIMIMLLFTFVFRLVGVSGRSMLPTLRDGDWMCVSAFCAIPEQGDITIVTQPNFFHEPIVKRIIAVGGQTVNITSSGDVYVDGKLLNEPYISEKLLSTGDFTYPLQIPEGKVFVMGDNRNESTDSRSAMIGLIDSEYLLGNVRFRFSPLSQWKIEYASFDYE